MSFNITRKKFRTFFWSQFAFRVGDYFNTQSNLMCNNIRTLWRLFSHWISRSRIYSTFEFYFRSVSSVSLSLSLSLSLSFFLPLSLSHSLSVFLSFFVALFCVSLLLSPVCYSLFVLFYSLCFCFFSLWLCLSVTLSLFPCYCSSSLYLFCCSSLCLWICLSVFVFESAFLLFLYFCFSLSLCVCFSLSVC